MFGIECEAGVFIAMLSNLDGLAGYWNKMWNHEIPGMIFIWTFSRISRQRSRNVYQQGLKCEKCLFPWFPLFIFWTKRRWIDVSGLSQLWRNYVKDWITGNNSRAIELLYLRLGLLMEGTLTYRPRLSDVDNLAMRALTIGKTYEEKLFLKL